MEDIGLPQERIESFKEVCAVDEARARQYLIHCDGNLEDAIQLFFTTGGSLQNSYEAQHNAENERREQHRSRRSVSQTRQQQGSWWDTFVTLLSLPFRFTITTLYDLLNLLLEFFDSRRPALTDPVGDVERFISAYNESIPSGFNNRIDFYHGSFDDARRFAKNNLRMLLIYLHHPNCNDTPRFIETVLHSDLLKELIIRQNLIVFGVSATSPQGRAVAELVQSKGEPLLALITFHNNNSLIALRLSGEYEPETVVLNLRLACEDYQGQLNQMKMQRAQLQENQRIREEQEREYRESAAKDRAKIQERRRLESERAEAEELERKKQREANERKEILVKKRVAIRATNNDEASGEDLVRIQIRFPSGARLDRKFKPTDSLHSLFEAAFSHEQCPIYFTVFTNFPRKEVPCAPNWYYEIRAAQLRADGIDVPELREVRTFQEEGLDRSCVVMIQDCLA